MPRLLLTIILIFVSYSSSADFLYSGLNLVKPNIDGATKSHDLMVVGGLNLNTSELSSISIELEFNEQNDKNGLVLKSNVLYNYSFLNKGNLKPFVSVGLYGAAYETYSCTYSISSGTTCASDFLKSTGVILAIGSEITVSKNNNYLLKLSASKDSDNNNFISLFLAKEF